MVARDRKKRTGENIGNRCNMKEEKKAKAKFDKIMKKHGKKSGSGYAMNVEQLLKILEKGDEK